jgi:transcriptional regulator with XRE-family HTH domain
MEDTPLKRARQRRGLSQAEVARRTGIAQTHLGAIERGESEPTISKAHRIARVLKLPTRKLWPLPDEDTPKNDGGSQTSAA